MFRHLKDFRLFRSRKSPSITILQEPLDGGSCLNQRTIMTACELFDSSQNSGKSNQPIKTSELFEALWFLELLIVSRNITYDGTLPQRDLDNLDKHFDSLVTATSMDRNFFSSINPESDEQAFQLIRGSAEQAVATFADFQAHEALDRPLASDDAGRFFAELTTIGKHFSENRSSRALNAMVRKTAKAYQSQRFRGSKCIAGLASLGEAGAAAATAYLESTGNNKEMAAGALINRFRFFYVRNLSFSAHDVYVPASRWKGLSEQQAITFHEFVRQNFESRLRSGDSALASVVSRSDFLNGISLPPLGLYALMTTTEKNMPEAVVIRARETFSDYRRLFKDFWTTTRKAPVPMGGWGKILDIHETGNPKLDQYHSEVADFFGKRFHKLQAQAFSKPSAPSLTRRFLVPVLMSGTTALVTDQLTGGLTGLLNATAAMAGSVGVEYVSGQIESVIRGHADQYRELDNALLRDPELSRNMASIEDQVMKVFNRKLIAG